LITNEAKATPLLICHGERDQIVLFPKGELASKTIQEIGVPVTFKTYKNLVHSSSDAEMNEVELFITKQLPPKSPL